MSFDWLHYIDIAQELFSQAPNSSHKDASLRSSISRAYYGTFHKARHRIYSKWGVSVPEDATAHTQLRREFKKRNYQKIAATLNRMRVDRNHADYDDSLVNLTTTAQENLKRASNVVSELSKI